MGHEPTKGPWLHSGEGEVRTAAQSWTPGGHHWQIEGLLGSSEVFEALGLENNGKPWQRGYPLWVCWGLRKVMEMNTEVLNTILLAFGVAQ